MKRGKNTFEPLADETAPGLELRAPRATDGARVWDLIAANPALDGNSLYANLLQCSHFAETCALAEQNGTLVGWMSGYRPPEQPDTLFVWQICVSEAARGQGLGKRLVAEVLQRPGNQAVSRLSCTITEDNAASWALFGAIARTLEAPLQRQDHFTEEAHFAGRHASELAVTIGPFHRGRAAQLAAA
tara:strand:- start:1111 stop:1671 length:561 start_codon:yes stop_codon:yes gene_type:complete